MLQFLVLLLFILLKRTNMLKRNKPNSYVLWLCNFLVRAGILIPQYYSGILDQNNCVSFAPQVEFWLDDAPVYSCVDHQGSFVEEYNDDDSCIVDCQEVTTNSFKPGFSFA